MKYIDLDRGIFTDPVDGTKYICYGHKIYSYVYKLCIECSYEHLFGLIGYTTPREYDAFLMRYGFDFISRSICSHYDFNIRGTDLDFYKFIHLMNSKLTDIYYKDSSLITLDFE